MNYQINRKKDENNLYNLGVKYQDKGPSARTYYWRATNTLKDKTKEEGLALHKELRDDFEADPDLKKEVYDIVRKAISNIADEHGKLVSHAAIQDNLHTLDTINTQKELKQIFSNFNLNFLIGKNTYNLAKKIINASTSEEAESAYTVLVKDPQLDPTIKEAMCNVFRNTNSHVQDEHGNPVSHAEIQDKLHALDYIKNQKEVQKKLINTDLKYHYEDAVLLQTSTEKENTYIGLRDNYQMSPTHSDVSYS